MSIVLSDENFNDFETLQKIFTKDKVKVQDIYLDCNDKIESFFAGEGFLQTHIHKLDNNENDNLVVKNIYIFKTDRNTEINDELLDSFNIKPKEFISSIKANNIYKSDVRKSTVQNTIKNMGIRQNKRELGANQAYKKMLNRRKKRRKNT